MRLDGVGECVNRYAYRMEQDGRGRGSFMGGEGQHYARIVQIGLYADVVQTVLNNPID